MTKKQKKEVKSLKKKIKNKSKFEILFIFAKHLLETETLTFPGKMNLLTSVMILAGYAIMSWHIFFLIIYEAVFGKAIIDTLSFNYYMIYLVICVLGIVISEEIRKHNESKINGE